MADDATVKIGNDYNTTALLMAKELVTNLGPERTARLDEKALCERAALIWKVARVLATGRTS